jgi:hypothetical protein
MRGMINKHRKKFETKVQDPKYKLGGFPEWQNQVT